MINTGDKYSRKFDRLEEWHNGQRNCLKRVAETSPLLRTICTLSTSIGLPWLLQDDILIMRALQSPHFTTFLQNQAGQSLRLQMYECWIGSRKLHGFAIILLYVLLLHCHRRAKSIVKANTVFEIRCNSIQMPKLHKTRKNTIASPPLLHVQHTSRGLARSLFWPNQ